MITLVLVALTLAAIGALGILAVRGAARDYARAVQAGYLEPDELERQR